MAGVALRLSFEQRSKELLRGIPQKFSKKQIAEAHHAAGKFSSRKARDACRTEIVQAFAYEPARAQKLVVRKVYPRGWGLIISRKSVALGRSWAKVRMTSKGAGYKWMGRWRVMLGSFIASKGMRLTITGEGAKGSGRMGGVFVRDSRKDPRRVRYKDKQGKRNNKQLPVRQVWVSGPGAALVNDPQTVPRIMADATVDHERKFLRSLGLPVKARRRPRVRGRVGAV